MQKLEEKFANTPRGDEQGFDWRASHHRRNGGRRDEGKEELGGG